MSDARKLMSETIIATLRKERWFIVNGDDGGNELYHKVAHTLAAEIDKALGGLTPWTATEGDTTRSAWVSGWTVAQ
ncbi:Uncharacterised protein [Mycobacteroides abscessus subsp. abscessus]|uniref:hypothetical protein n=1 Tax=Mycobacteroides abscessus TaxID=36809 RepID=UPI00092666C9|nr:hypothetical protein [Mycobacteroides abscessus]SIC55733.1 Uncharacterised protein [Mycobacteroides abscessus subsp. abscessus]SKU58164.1 Uncharacterised protein [Mycobacteroides abscessus subsp. abscessus]